MCFAVCGIPTSAAHQIHKAIQLPYQHAIDLSVYHGHRQAATSWHQSQSLERVSSY